MKSPVILIAIAMNIIVSLLLFLQSVPSPMDQHYQDCLKQISLQTGIKQEVSLLQYYPDLKIAKTNCETVKLLRTEIENMFHPSNCSFNHRIKYAIAVSNRQLKATYSMI